MSRMYSSQLPRLALTETRPSALAPVRRKRSQEYSIGACAQMSWSGLTWELEVSQNGSVVANPGHIMKISALGVYTCSNLPAIVFLSPGKRFSSREKSMRYFKKSLDFPLHAIHPWAQQGSQEQPEDQPPTPLLKTSENWQNMDAADAPPGQALAI